MVLPLAAACCPVGFVAELRDAICLTICLARHCRVLLLRLQAARRTVKWPVLPTLPPRSTLPRLPLPCAGEEGGEEGAAAAEPAGPNKEGLAGLEGKVDQLSAELAEVKEMLRQLVKGGQLAVE